MNRLTRRYYAVDRLPDDLRDGLQENGDVLVEISSDVPLARPRLRISGLVARFPAVHGAENEVLDHVRSLREE